LTLLEAWPYRSAEVFDGYVVRSAESPRPAVAPTRVAAAPPSGGVSRWRNLAYALQWWLFAGAAVFFWAAVIRRAAVERRTERSDTAPPVPV
jgi:cytochrome oxidase assembly protein ShyY1